MKNFILLFNLFIGFISFAQDKEIELLQNFVNNNLVLSIKNNSTERKEVKLIVNGSSKIESPIVKLVNKGETIEFVTIDKSSASKVSFAMSYKSKPNNEELVAKNDKLKALEGKASDDLSKGIVVFTKEGCPRCEKTVNYLLSNNINFKYLNTSGNTEINQLMWSKLNEKKASNNITMPVVIVNGKLSYSHPDLDAFLKTLK